MPALDVREPNPTQPVHRDTRLPATAAGLVGVLTVVAALAAGQLVAGFIGTAASPLLAVGAAAVDLSPGRLKEFAIQSFGTSDKSVLLGGIAVVLLAVGVVAGLVSRRRPSPGITIAALVGCLGIIAVATRPRLAGTAVLAPMMSLLVAVTVFWGLHRLASAVPVTTTTTPSRGQDAGRRRFLLSAAGVAAGAVAAYVAGRFLASARAAAASRAAIGRLLPSTPGKPIPRGADFAADGTPTFLTPNRDFYRVDTALTVPQIDARNWSLRVHGMVDRERTFAFDEIRRHPLVQRPITLTCVSNPVGGPYVSTAEFVGVPLASLLRSCGMRRGADQLFSTSEDGFTAGSPLPDVLARGMLAIGMNGRPLPPEHGFPARLVVPGLYGYVSATKWVTDLEVTTFAARSGYWIPRGWSRLGPIKTESRIDVPKPSSTVRPGTVIVAGLAWAQPHGIAKVQVQLDHGPWLTATLSTPINPDTWRMWRIALPALRGHHTVRCRATDATGRVQTARQASPAPDGASGWPAVSFTAT